MVGMMALAFFGKVGADFSRVWIATWYVAALSMLFAERLALSLLAKRWIREGRLNRRAVIVGGGREAEELIKALEASTDTDIRIAGIFDDRGDERVSPIVAGYPKLGKSISSSSSRATRGSISSSCHCPSPPRSGCSSSSRSYGSCPSISGCRRTTTSSDSARAPIPISATCRSSTSPTSRSPIGITSRNGCSTRSSPRLRVILLAPVMAVIAILIKLDSKGPVLFRQKRQGFNNELIDVYKFRSMYVEHADAEASKLVTKDDPRVTRVGRFLRKTSLDELPQLFNVLKGELSLVGPRPHALKAKAEDKLYSEVVDGYFARHRVKPGVTGWAQINGWRGETDTEEKIQRRVEHDLYYIENWSVIFDLYICLMTPFALLKGENAY